MDIFTELRPLIRRIEQTLMDTINPGFPRTLREPMHYFLETPGKKLRPLMALLTCDALGRDPELALPVAAGVELFHDFTLLHDDIMDQDDLRRGRLTVHRKWDESTAILVGDAMVGMACASVSRVRPEILPQVMALFSDALIKVCEGQALDKEFELQPKVSLEDYMDMISKKTAWLFQLSCQLGALVVGGSPQQVASLAQFGYHLGMAFQIQDDLLDFVADESKLGKKVGSDLKMDKKTYVTLKYREVHSDYPDLPEKLSGFGSLEELRKALETTGVITLTRQAAEDFFNRARQNLQQVPAIAPAHPLYRLLDFMQNRQY